MTMTMNMKRILIFLLIYSTNSLSGVVAYQSNVQSFVIAAYLMTGVFKYNQESYISDLTLHKQESLLFSSDKEKPTSKKSCISYPINCPDGKKEGSQTSENQASAQSDNQQVVDSTDRGTKNSQGKASFCGSDGNDPDPPEENQDNPAEKYGVECLPVWKEEQSENTVVFVIKTKNLRVPDKTSDLGHTTPAATIYIDGQAVTFYIRWGYQESSDPFLVARGEDWQTQENSDEVPGFLPGFLLALLAQSNPQTTLEEAGEIVHKLGSVLPSFTRRGGQNYILMSENNFRLANHPTINIPTISLSSSSVITGAEALDPKGWSQNSIWSIHVTNSTNTVTAQERLVPDLSNDLQPPVCKKNKVESPSLPVKNKQLPNTLAISLEEITFQDRADTFLLDGNAMDGWREAELKKHLCRDHNIEVNCEITEINDLPAVQGCSRCERISMQGRQLRAFWSSLRNLLDREDCPEELHFKVTIKSK